MWEVSVMWFVARVLCTQKATTDTIASIGVRIFVASIRSDATLVPVSRAERRKLNNFKFFSFPLRNSVLFDGWCESNWNTL